MKTVGLVGGIAAGKSEVGRLLAGLGARVVDADLLAHQAYAPGSPGFEALVAAFGSGIVGPDGAIDRGRLGEMVFGDPQRLKRLTAIVWPLTRALAQDRMREAEAEGAPVFVLEAPLLIEAGWRDLVDEVWLVETTPEEARRRLKGRGLNDAAIEVRLTSRNLEEARRAATLVIDNSGDLESLRAKVESAWRRLTR